MGSRRTIGIARADAADDGFILVAVLWILGGLATLAAVYALYVVNAASGLRINSDRLQAEAGARSALELTAYYLDRLDKQTRPSTGAYDLRLGDYTVAITFASEAGRIDLNLAPKQLLAGLFTALGAAPSNAALYASRIEAWRMTNNAPNPDSDAEITAYRNAGLPYPPRRGPFNSVDELWLVLGLPPAFVDRALPYVTVFSGAANVDVMAAAPQVLAALPGMTPDRLNEVLAARMVRGATAQTVQATLGPAQGGTAPATSKSYRVTARVRLSDGRLMTAEAVILLLEKAPDPYRVLSWTDDFDG